MWNDLWWTEEAEERFNQSLNGMKLDVNIGKLMPRYVEAGTETNWLFFGHSGRHMDCGLWHAIMFKFFNFVPSYCRFRCYKVVIRIPTVETLLRFHNFVQAFPLFLESCTPLHGKCGIDERWYTDTPYDAFFYCDGLEMGIERYKQVKSLLRDHFSFAPDLPVILKRACTEFERAYGPTNGEFWQEPMPLKHIDLQRRLEDVYASTLLEVRQPEWLVNKVYRRWIKFANTHGDKTWLNYYAGESDFLSAKATTYHHLADETKGMKGRDSKGKFTKVKE